MRHFIYKGKRVEIVDLPGVYSLSAAGGSTSLDEQIARDFILSGEPKLIVNIVDASNITNAGARLRADVDSYSFIVSDSHRLLLAGLPAHSD